MERHLTAVDVMTDTARLAVVTGAGRPNGLGAAVVREFRRRGITVVVADVINETWGMDEIDVGVHFIKTDLNDAADTQRLLEDIEQQFGRLDILVNNAAAPQGKDRADIADVPLDAFESVFQVGLLAPFILIHGAVPLMRRYGWGRIVSIASIDGLTPKPTRGAYCASKSALIALTRSVALDVAKDGITANSVCPGSMKTARAMKTVARRLAAGVVASEEDAFAAEIARIPIGRFGGVEEVARIVSFLASDAGAYVTAEAWGAHGGQLFTGYLGT